ncbi:Carnitine O-acetyltransferase mitochondrial [Chytridiales sp. JEL 0842]|nr:Carnitine O-acetyltransferase mitochondrial [Chytridiales sp. JEL 0842]
MYTTSLKPSGPNKPMYQHQPNLPKLPVPTLAETAEKYLKTVRPHFSDAEYAATEAAVRAFVAPNGPGQELQKRLEKRRDTEPTSWLLEWWNDLSYMGYRDPVVIFVSYFFCFRDEVRPQWKAPASRAAAITTAALEFKRKVVEEEIVPEMVKGGALSMDQYRYLFNTCRVPKIPSDVTFVADPRKNNHIIAVRKNQFFAIDTKHPDGRNLSTMELAKQFEKVYQLAGDKAATPVGVLTASNRDVWAKNRDELLKASPANKASLDTIESAAFVVCLDDTKPVSREEMSRACWHGDARNRFWDKACQFIVFDNGKAGFNGEHSMMDATPTNQLCDWLCDSLAKDKVDHQLTVPVSASLPGPKPLKFELNMYLTEQIKFAERDIDELIAKHDLHVQAFHGYGKNQIKKMGLSPDAYVQMAIQLAYYKMYGVSRPTYESAQTRKYAYGRTETCRTVSVDSVAWVKAMQNGALSKEEKAALGKKAISSHVKYMADCVDGRGVDRHLLGLKLLVANGEKMPEIFTDKAFAYTKHWNLSTSQITSEYYEGYGWGEVVPDGYGIAYMIKDRSIHLNVACLNEMNAPKMKYYLEEALLDMRNVFEVPEAPKAKL